MSKDPRYAAVKSMLDAGKLTSMKQIFEIIPMTVIHRDTKIHYPTLHRRVNNPELLTLSNFVEIAKLIDVKPEIIFKLAVRDSKIFDE